MRLRFPVPPERTTLRNFKVFISYRSTQFSVASRLRLELEKVGFEVLMIEPSEYELYRTNNDLLIALREKVRQADAICVVVSDTLEPSEYVQSEINEALRGLRRVIFVHDGTTKVPDRFEFHDPGPARYNVGFVFKHTVVSLRAWDECARQELATEIMNDPDEGWFDDPSQIQSWWHNRDFHTESVLRKYVRQCLHVDRHTGGHIIRDVMPLMKSWHYPDDPDEVFLWYARTFGGAIYFRLFVTASAMAWSCGT